MSSQSFELLTRVETGSYSNVPLRRTRTSQSAPCQVAQTVDSSSSSSHFTTSERSSRDDYGPPNSLDTFHESSPLRPSGIQVRLGDQTFFRFKSKPDKSTDDRLNDFIHRVEPLLHARLKKTGGRIGPTAFHTMNLGTTEENAYQHVIVLCPYDLREVVKKFLEKDRVIRELRESFDQGQPISIIVDGRRSRLIEDS
ncbi:uncharacterized protein CCOS01_16009 [Colletotrichum costaricense]|uniref:Uncharacterized protein n=1 Tax=Colletotrichum costaricense TaxID=1209916 RepID=A0AAI9YG47_9PEZI|nr:uncharacterized protein CCOS01_16009 [Colletotrichum costaricense]KAK1508008.1 hypothetical protein CCOS01_16009 [Colletotrichum costaricense]